MNPVLTLCSSIVLLGSYRGVYMCTLARIFTPVYALQSPLVSINSVCVYNKNHAQVSLAAYSHNHHKVCDCSDRC